MPYQIQVVIQKFEDLPGGWHTDYFLVSDVPHYNLIIGMPCLLQDKIKNKLIAPLILYKSQKRENRGMLKIVDL